MVSNLVRNSAPNSRAHSCPPGETAEGAAARVCRRWGPGSLRSGGRSLQRLQKGLRRALSPLFFFARVRALCVPRGTSHHDEFEWAVRGMSLTRTTSRTKPNPKPNTTPSKTTNKPETKGSGSSPYESKRAKGADPRTNTVVKRGNEFISSRSQWRTSRAKLHSNAICVWAGVYSFSGAQRAEMPEHTESESKVQFRFD